MMMRCWKWWSGRGGHGCYNDTNNGILSSEQNDWHFADHIFKYIFWLKIFIGIKISPLLWRYNGHDSVYNHQPHECLLNSSFRCRSKRTSKLRVTGLCVGNSPETGEFPHKWPVTRKMFPFGDVIMTEICPCQFIWWSGTTWMTSHYLNNHDPVYCFIFVFLGSL